MAEELLYKLILGEVDAQTLCDWLTRKSNNVEYGTSRGEFATTTLNFIHDESLRKCGVSLITPDCSCNSSDLNTSTPLNKKPFHVVTPVDHSLHYTPRSSSFYSPRSQSGLNNHDTLSPTTNSSSHRGQVTPQRSNVSTRPNSTPTGPDRYSLADFMTQSSSSSAKRLVSSRKKHGEHHQQVSGQEDNSMRRARRINPTNLNQRKFSSSFETTSNSYNFARDCEDVSAKSHTESALRTDLELSNRENLVDVVHKMGSLNLRTPTKRAAATPISMQRSRPIRQGITEADIESHITFRTELYNLSCVYNALISNTFVLSLASELHLVISLLLSSCNNAASFNLNTTCHEISFSAQNAEQIFQSAHNLIHFATLVLPNERLRRVMTVLDRVTIKYLLDNERLKTLCPSTHHYLSEVYQSKPFQVDNIRAGHVPCNWIFVYDSDQRNNFVTDTAFHAFRKQRDLFYDILSEWDKVRNSEEFTFGEVLGGRIKYLLNRFEQSNHVQLAKLFRAQLLHYCILKTDEAENFSSDQLSFLSAFPSLNADKLSRLRTRLVTKQPSSTGLNATPKFTGHQEFFHNFITTGNHYVFNVNLKDVLVAELFKINDVFHVDDDDFDATNRDTYMICLQAMRILAKFAGFLESMPYSMPETQTAAYNEERVLQLSTEMRRHHRPTFNLSDFLVNQCNKSLALVIPWVTEYMALLDAVTLRLPYYEKLINILFEIYHKSQFEIIIQLCLGWLFELSNFPSERYFSWCDTHVEGNVASLSLGVEPFAVPYSTKSEKDLFDSSSMVYAVCPYLSEFRRLVHTANHPGGSRRSSIKHITPLSAPSEKSCLDSKKDEKSLEQKLIDSFLRNQPASTRQAVECVAEMACERCRYLITNEIIPNYIASAKTDFRSYLADVALNSMQAQPGNSQPDVDDGHAELTASKLNLPVVLRKSVEFQVRSLNYLRILCETHTQKALDEKVAALLLRLYPDSEYPATLRQFCYVAALRITSQKLKRYISENLDMGLFGKTFDLEIEKLKEQYEDAEYITSSEQANGEDDSTLDINEDSDSEDSSDDSEEGPDSDAENDSDVKKPTASKRGHFSTTGLHNPAHLTSEQLLRLIANSSIKLIEGRNVSLDEIEDVFVQARNTISERRDTTESAQCSINTQLFDLYIFFVGNHPDLITDGLSKTCCDFWKAFVTSTGAKFVLNLISQDVVMVLCKSKNGLMVSAMNRLCDLLSLFLEAKMITVDEIRMGIFKLRARGAHVNEKLIEAVQEYKNKLETYFTID